MNPRSSHEYKLPADEPNTFGTFNALPLADQTLALDMMANTGCSYMAVCSAFAVWHSLGAEGANRCFDNGKYKRSVKIGHSYGADVEWIITVK